MVTWCGHSYVILSYGGKRIAIDPHDGDSLNLPRCRVDATYVLVTHDHYDHNAVELARGPSTRSVVKWSAGRLNLGDLIVVGVENLHDPRGAFGKNVSYLLTVEGLRVAHLGDVGEPPSGRLLSALGKADVAFVPAGDVTTVSQADAIKWAEAIGARIVVPVHYWVAGSTSPLDPLDKFLSLWRGKTVILDTNAFEVSKESLPSEATLFVLRPPSHLG